MKAKDKLYNVKDLKKKKKKRPVTNVVVQHNLVNILVLLAVIHRLLWRWKWNGMAHRLVDVESWLLYQRLVSCNRK